MPHCIVECSKELPNSLSQERLIEVVHQAALASGLFEEQSIKTRVVPYHFYQIGNAKIPFVHVTLKILSGRNHQEKKVLSKRVLDSLKEISCSPASLTVDVVDIEKAPYAKLTL